jgi:hypothetical protein
VVGDAAAGDAAANHHGVRGVVPSGRQILARLGVAEKLKIIFVVFGICYGSTYVYKIAPLVNVM